ncbi:hypothetical protein [Flavobacterium fluviatile]|uniref:hypothetical protein n=1 Tax=Flavobacterium fluviatile TaxID=1862387 RepID=UPI0013D14782|nr:hypothetical protein [Flavobacterium fluviatile]
MKSTEVYKEINSIIFPNMKSNGFKKTKSGMLGYYKLLKEFYLVIWFQCSQDGFDKYAGSKFIVEIQISKTNEIGKGSIIRRRIPYFLTENDFGEIVITENQIKDKFQKPPKTHYIFSLAENVQNWYYKKFEKTNTTYNESSDIWFVYFNEADVQKWAKLIEPMINRIVCDFEQTEY